jgi:hypothetical protein
MLACTSNQQLNSGATVNRFVPSTFLAVAAMIAAAAPASAQGYNPFQIGASGGIAFPVSDLGNVTNTGYNVSVMVGYKPQLTPISVRAEAAYNQFGSKVFNGNVNIPAFTGNLVFGLPMGMLSPYAIGGAGLYRTNENVTNGGRQPLLLQHRWRDKNSAEHQFRDVRRSPLQSCEHQQQRRRQQQPQLRSDHSRSDVLARRARANKKGQSVWTGLFHISWAY